MGSKLSSGINSMYDDSSACVRVKWDESERFRTDSGVRQGYIMSPWLFNVYMDSHEGEDGDGKRGVSGDCLASCM